MSIIEGVCLSIATFWTATYILTCINLLLGFDGNKALHCLYDHFDFKLEKYGDLVILPLKSIVFLVILFLTGILMIAACFGVWIDEGSPVSMFLKGIGQNKNVDSKLRKMSDVFESIKKHSWDRPLPTRSKENKIEKLKAKLRKLEG